VLESNKDPGHLRDQLLYNLMLERLVVRPKSA